MTESRFDIIFRGDIVPGHQLMQVKARLAQLFKADEQKINTLFTGGAVALKRNLEQDAAEKYQVVLRNAGADVQVAPAGSVNTPGSRTAQKSVASRSQSAPASTTTMTLKDRLAAAAASDTANAAQTGNPSAEDTGRQEAIQQVVNREGVFALAPVGAYLLDDSERQHVEPVNVDTSFISLRPQQGNLMDESEIVHEKPVIVNADFDLGEVGADILSASEKRVMPQATVKAPDVDLAPAGSDLGQIQRDEPPSPPDTSKISIEPIR